MFRWQGRSSGGDAWVRLGDLRSHVNSHLAESKFEISTAWLEASHSRWCPCSKWITSISLLCSSCRGSNSEIVHRRTPIADGLPLLLVLSPISLSGSRDLNFSHWRMKRAVRNSKMGTLVFATKHFWNCA